MGRLKRKAFFDTKESQEDHEKEWQGMPEFVHEDLTSYRQIVVHFKSKEARKEFAELIDQTVSSKTQSIWFPQAIIDRYIDKRYTHES